MDTFNYLRISVELIKSADGDKSIDKKYAR